MGRIREWGYPSGWSWVEGGKTPMEKSRRVIESRRGGGDEDWDFDEVGLLEMYDREEGTDLQLEEEEETTNPMKVLETPLPPQDEPPPLPPGSPPPLPPGPPPPPPPPEETTRKIHRLVDYRTFLFDSKNHFLSFSPERYYASFNREETVSERVGREQAGKREGDGEDVDGEEEMDFGDSDEEN